MGLEAFLKEYKETSSGSQLVLPERLTLTHNLSLFTQWCTYMLEKGDPHTRWVGEREKERGARLEDLKRVSTVCLSVRIVCSRCNGSML